jgi:hypothetical protein
LRQAASSAASPGDLNAAEPAQLGLELRPRRPFRVRAAQKRRSQQAADERELVAFRRKLQREQRG